MAGADFGRPGPLQELRSRLARVVQGFILTLGYSRFCFVPVNALNGGRIVMLVIGYLTTTASGCTEETASSRVICGRFGSRRTALAPRADET
jgi:hypothetical protein